MKIFTKLVVILVASIALSGCGETIRGVGRDTSRIVRGTKTIFISGK